MKKTLFLILKISLFSVLCSLFSVYFWWSWAIQAPDSERAGEAKNFIILKGESTNSIAQRLHQEGLIRSPLAFKIILYQEMLAGKIQAGSFQLKPSMNPKQITEALTHGTSDIWITIPEGWRSEEIIAELNRGLAPQKTQNFTEDTEKFKENEGYLFPDTYLFPKEATSSLIIKKMQDNFSLKFSPKLREEAEKKDLTIEEVVILASLVEREVKHDQDRPIVAGILIKRWQNNWALQVDATVQYAIANSKLKPSSRAQVESAQVEGNQNSKLENWWPKVNKEDLKISSSYNTYKSPGLPPAPICNPGLASIEAVIYPKETPYWYYLSDSQGNMHYAQTIDEHNLNIAKHLQ